MKKTYQIFLYGILFFVMFSTFKLCGVKLYEIVKGGCLDEVKMFFETYKTVPQRALLDELDKYGKSALYYACEKGNLAMVQYLYRMGTSLHSVVSRDSSTALHIASKYGHEDSIHFLLRNGVNPHKLNKENYSSYDFLSHAPHMSSYDKKEFIQLFDTAVLWANYFKEHTAEIFFLEELENYLSFRKNGESNNTTENLRLGFFLAYNQGIIQFFKRLYYQLYVKTYDDSFLQEKQKSNRDTLEILYGASQQFCSQLAYQAFFIEKSIRDKNSEFLAAALNADWGYNKEKIIKTINSSFSLYQRDMLTKVLFGKKTNACKRDINFYYLE